MSARGRDSLRGRFAANRLDYRGFTCVVRRFRLLRLIFGLFFFRRRLVRYLVTHGGSTLSGSVYLI